MPFESSLVYFALYIKRYKLNLFPHAEVGEDIVKDVIGCNFAAGDFCKVVKANTKIFNNEVCWSLVLKGLLCLAKGCK